jgi:imidazolonepropionase-like amidohydrolase
LWTFALLVEQEQRVVAHTDPQIAPNTTPHAPIYSSCTRGGGAGTPAIEKGTIVVNGTTIQAVGANVQVPAGARRVNLTGKTVMPMILDTHIHAPATSMRPRRANR